MDRAYVYNKVRSLLAVFVAFEVLNDEDKKPGRGKTRQWIRRRDERGYFNNTMKELVTEDTVEYKDMMRMSHADFQRIYLPVLCKRLLSFRDCGSLYRRRPIDTSRFSSSSISPDYHFGFFVLSASGAFLFLVAVLISTSKSSGVS